MRQGRTDAWIAHQLEVTVQQIESFKRENELAPDAADAGDAAPGTDFDDEIDLRAEDDALIAAELEAEQARAAEEAARKAAEEAAAKEAGEESSEDEKPTRRRGRRGRGRKAKAVLEGTFDHGEEGYGLWLDAAVADEPVYAEHWAGHRPVEVTVEPDRIVIRRVEVDDDGDDD